jgi:hypothetical protein
VAFWVASIFKLVGVTIRGLELDLGPSTNGYLKRNLFVRDLFQANQRQFGYAMVHPEATMCTASSCAIEAGGVPLYRDTNHITRTQVLRLAPLFDGIWAR